jgi:hypothetical protein
MTADRLLLLLLRFNGAVLLLAAPCALLPFSWMDTVHRDWLELGPLPDALITRYLTRSLALTYALHGAVVLALTSNWPRYRPLVPILGCLHIAFGCAIVVVDWSAGIPWWWALGEGSSAGFGVVLLLVYPRASRANPDVPRAGG